MIIPPDIFITQPLHEEDIELLLAIEEEEEILFEKETPFNFLQVTQNRYGRFLKFEESYQAGFLTHKAYSGNLPYLNYFLLGAFLKKDIKNVLMLGFGTGQTAKELIELAPTIKTIDIIELEPDVIDVAKEFFGYEDNKKINIHIQDARVFIQGAKRKYDMVILDLFSSEGMSYRFMTQEFLQEVKNILTKDGLISANIFSNKLLNSEKNNLFKSMLKTYQSVFAEIQLYPTNYANEVMYRNVFGLKHHFTDLVNIILFASCNDFNPLQEVNNFDNYIKDRYNDKVGVEDVKILLDEFIEEFPYNVEEINSYLLINNM